MLKTFFSAPQSFLYEEGKWDVVWYDFRRTELKTIENLFFSDQKL